MTPAARPDWNEEKLSEIPAVELLQKLGYTYVSADELEKERESPEETILIKRLSLALQKLNPKISIENIMLAVKAITEAHHSSLVETNMRAYEQLVYGYPVLQDLGEGNRNHTVNFIDFDSPENNEFIATRQYKVEGEQNIIPDIVVFVNGLPLAVIECKSPTIGERWLEEAITQLIRYQGLDSKNPNGGAANLFATVQVLIVACGAKASSGTVGTPVEQWAEWKEPYPISKEQLAKILGRNPQNQDIALYGLLEPKNLLNITRNFVVFEKSVGRFTRKNCRYKQFSAVNKTIERIISRKTSEERGGIIWHTQGSGKSLIMLWLTQLLRRSRVLNNPTIAIVTDRVDLDRQITSTFRQCGFPNPNHAKNAVHLRKLLAGPTGKTVMTTIQKFVDIDDETDEGLKASTSATYPTLSSADNIYVLTDEAHRTQYGTLAANMRKALPNACFIAFTGTPIDKESRSTFKIFGSYIDKYTSEQAVDDKVTVPIFYESRLPQLRIIGPIIDEVFERVFRDLPESERAEIKHNSSKLAMLAAAPKRIEAICLDILDHYEKNIKPNGFKAQIVASSRNAAVAYKEQFDRLNSPVSALFITADNKDPENFRKLAVPERERESVKQEFKDPKNPLSILIVCEMLHTGFDAPVEQVMYLDAPLREHALLQAIARVNRVAELKTYGLVVDYWGVSEELLDALKIFSSSDIKGALHAKIEEWPRLESRHSAAMRFFHGVSNMNNIEECALILEPEDLRSEFSSAFREFSESLDMMLPDPRALPYVKDFKKLGAIRAYAKLIFEGQKLKVSDVGGKVRKLIEEAVIASGIQTLIKQVPVFSIEYEEMLDQHRTPEAKATEMAHALRREIHLRMDDNPAFYGSLLEQLESLIEARNQKRIDAAKMWQLLIPFKSAISSENVAASQAGMSSDSYAIYGIFKPIPYVAEPIGAYDPSIKALSEKLEKIISKYTRFIDWDQKHDHLRTLRNEIKDLLLDFYDDDRCNEIIDKLVNLTIKRKRS